MKRFVFVVFVLSIMAVISCSLNEPAEYEVPSEVFLIKCNIEDFVPDVATKVSWIDGTSTWTEGDVIGVFPDLGGDQVSFTISGGAGTNTCVFNGEGWGLVTSAKYSAYYPFHPENYGDADAMKAVKVSYNGQSQYEKNTFSTGCFDYLACTNATPSFDNPDDQGGECTFNFKHLGALLILDITFPSAVSLSTLELVCNNSLFTQTGTVDLTQATAAITSTANGNSLSIDLGGMSVVANETVTFYMMTAPDNLTSERATVKVTTTDGREMTKKLSKTYNLEAGKSYSISATLGAPVATGPTLKASLASHFCDYKGQLITFNITSDESYTLTPTVSWISKISETVVSQTGAMIVKEFTYHLGVNNGSAARSGYITIAGETLTKSVYVSQTGLTLHVPSAGEGLTIYNTTGQFKYRYGPSIITNDNGTIDAWFASPGSLYSSSMADVFTWRRTSDGGQSWTNEQVVLTGSAKPAEDWWSVCDPGAACFDGYYYIAYTSTTNTSSDGGLQGLENNCYIARGTSPSGPWQKWNGTGWGGNPKPIIRYMDGSEHNDGPAGKWGIGEPSIVVKDDTIYIYYTYDDGTTALTKVATANRSDINWPGNLTFHGTAVDKAWLAAHDNVTGTDLATTYDSCDVKYVEDYDLFYAFHTSFRLTAQSRLSVWTSTDGLTFTYLGDVTGNVIQYAHNMGVSGDGLGHVNLSKPQYVSYAYRPTSEPLGPNGRWSTYWSVLTY